VDQSRSQAIEGSGLGLAIVQQLVTLNQANIKITDNQPSGSIFTVSWQL
ncbi:MAG: ATP-binding protein, partial [Lactobacillus sp.]|nr:ATP-binding protein [Lactobacillus sp.]